MVQLEGTYQFVSGEGYQEYLKTFGLSDEAAEKIAGSTVPVIISSVTSDSITINYGTKTHTFPLGQQSEIVLSMGEPVKVTPTINGDTITFHSILGKNGEISEEKTFKISDSELVSTSTNSKGGKTVRHFKRA